MTTHDHSSPAPVSSSSVAEEVKPPPAAVTPAPVAPPAATPAPVAQPPASVASIVFIKPPPADANIPTPPEGATNANGVDYRAALPKKLELSAMPDVVAELQRFANYTEIFGKTAPPLEYVLQTAIAAAEWSAMRVLTEAWDAYSRTQEGASWADFRIIMEAMSPALDLAVKTDGTVSRQYPAIVRLFDAKRVIAKRGVVTRQVNKQNVAKGKAPTRGKEARAISRAKAAAAKVGATLTLPGAPAPSAPPPPPAPVADVAPAPAPAPANGATNGASHS
jgi:hypothetical protein